MLYVKHTPKCPPPYHPPVFPACCSLIAAAEYVFFTFGSGCFVRPQSTPRNAFGPPSPDLDTSQRYYFSALLIIERRRPASAHRPQRRSSSFPGGARESPATIARQIEEEGLIRRAQSIYHLFDLQRMDTTLQAGTIPSAGNDPGSYRAHHARRHPHLRGFHGVGRLANGRDCRSLPTQG